MYRILIADDEELEREALKAIINKGIDSAVEIQEAVNGRESVVKAKSFNPDIVFMDIKMPGINGIEAARMIRDYSDSVSIIFLTAFNQFEYAREAIQIGVEDFIIKPASELHVLEITGKLLDRIEKARAARSAEEDNELKLGRVKEYLETEFIYNLAIRGISEEKFLNYLAILDVHFLRGIAGIASVQFDTYPINVGSDYHRHVLRRRVSFIIKSVVGDMGFSVLVNIEMTNVYFLAVQHPDSPVSMEDVDWLSVVNKIAGEVDRVLTVKMVAGFGHVFSSPSDSVSSFASAKKALSDGAVSSKHTSEGLESLRLINLEIDLEEALLKGKRPEVMDVFQKLREYLEGTVGSFDQIKQYLAELGMVIKHYAAYQFPDGFERVDLSGIYDAADIGALTDEFVVFLTSLLVQRNMVSEMNYSPAIEAACSYIGENFRQDITLEDAAGKAGLSSFYFSRLFKKSRGVTFIEYITMLRVDEARKLLKETTLSIGEISERVGYSDQNYFTRVFKRYESVSPSVYRARKS